MANRPKFRRRKGRATPEASEEAADRRPAPPPARRMQTDDQEAEAQQKARAATDQQAEAARRLEEARRREKAKREAARRAAEEAARADEAHRAEAAASEAERRSDTSGQVAAAAGQPTDPDQAEKPLRLGQQLRDRLSTTHPDLWRALPEFTVDERLLDRNRIVTASRHDPAHAAFDVLRTRLLQALSEHGWKRVAVTSPTKDCGKTFTAANLAISLSRQETARTLLLDLDLRNPSLHKVFGQKDPGSLGDVLRGAKPPERHLRRLGATSFHAGRNIAFGFNDTPEPYASELLADPRTAANLEAMERTFRPDVILFDLPPALYYDDVIAFRPQFDGVLLVVGGGLTTEKEIREVERRLGDTVPLLGMVLNRAENTELKKYSY